MATDSVVVSDLSPHNAEAAAKFKEDCATALSGVSKLLLCVDVGGTNTRVALRPLGGDGTSLLRAHFVLSSSKTLTQAVLPEVEAAVFSAVPDAVVAGAVLAITGAIQGAGESASVPGIANFLPGENSLALSELPRRLFPVGVSSLLNDMYGTAGALIDLSSSKTLDSCYSRLWGEGATPTHLDSGKNYAVVNVGTGLGNFALCCNLAVFPVRRTAGPEAAHTVLPMELGHTNVVDLAPRYAEVLAELQPTVRGGTYPLEWDDLLSGRGLDFFYAYYRKKDGKDVPAGTNAGTVASSWRTDPDAEKAMLIFHELLFVFGSNLCVTTQAQGLILAGANTQTNSEFLQEHAGRFKDVFHDHSMDRLQWMSRVEVLVQTKEPVEGMELNQFGLLGLAALNAS